MKKKLLIFIILIFCFFISSVEVNALPESVVCKYSSGSEKIKIELVPKNLKGKLFMSYDTSEYINFYPINNIIYNTNGFFKDSISFLNWPYVDDFSLDVAGCPKQITTYYIEGSSPFETYIANIEDDTLEDEFPLNSPMIYFSKEAISTNYLNDYEVYDLSSDGDYLDKCMADNQVTGLEACGIYATNIDVTDAVGKNLKTKIYSIEINDTMIANGNGSSNPDDGNHDNTNPDGGNTDDTNPDDGNTDDENENNFLSCNYRNTSGTTITFNFNNKENVHNYEYNGKTYTVYHTNRELGASFNSCSSTILLTSFAEDGIYFSTPSVCDAAEYNCFYREDLDFTYENNAEVAYKYVKTSTSSDVISVNVLKVPDANGNNINVTRGKSNLTISNLSSFESIFIKGEKDSLPKYIVAKANGDDIVYAFSDKADSTARYNYVLSSYLNSIALDGEAIEATCRDIIGGSGGLLSFLNNNVLKIIYIGVPILLIVLTSFDFAKVVFINDKEGIQNAGKRFGKRVIVAVLIYFVPTILIFVTGIIGTDKVSECAKILQEISKETNS